MILGRIHQIQLSDDPRIIYELKPNLRLIDDAGKEYTTNSVGFRGPNVSAKRSPGTIRILGLGDSVMYGNGVSDDENFMSLLSARLNAEYPNESWEIINTAVGGYNTTMEVETLEQKGLAYEPDMVIIMFVANDLSLPNFIREPIDPLTSRSRLVALVKERVQIIARERLVKTPRSETGFYIRDREQVPPEYWHMIGPDAYRTAMRRLKALSVEHGFELLVIHKHDRKVVIETSRELEISRVTFERAIEEAMEELGIEEWNGSILSVSKTDPHPSPLGHAIYSNEIFEYLESSGTISRLRSRAAP